MISPGSVRVRLRYADLATFVQKFAPNVTRGGIFLASRTPRPPGELFRFEVQLANGQIALSGEGKVIWVKEYSPEAPHRAHGMGVQFLRVDPGSRATLEQILKTKRPSGTPPGGIVGTALHGSDSGRVGADQGLVGVDTNADLATEFGFDEAALRRAVERNRTTSARADEDLEELQRPETVEAATLSQALAELPRLLDPARRRTGPLRPLELSGQFERAAADSASGARAPLETVAEPAGTQGLSHDESTP